MTGLRSRRTVAVVAAVVGGALLVVGCGGSDSDDYKEQVTKAAQQFKTDAQQAGNSLGGAQSPTQFRAAAGEFKGAVTKFTDKLNSLDPPSDAKDEQDKLVNDLQHFSGTVNDISDKVQSATRGDARGLVALVPQLQSDVQKVSKDAQDLQNAVNNS